MAEDQGRHLRGIILIDRAVKCSVMDDRFVCSVQYAANLLSFGGLGDFPIVLRNALGRREMVKSSKTQLRDLCFNGGQQWCLSHGTTADNICYIRWRKIEIQRPSKRLVDI